MVRRLKSVVIGTGRLGINLSTNLINKNWNISYLISRKNQQNPFTGRSAPEWRNLNDFSGAVGDSSIIFIAVPDSVIEETAEKILKMNVGLKGKVFLHFSGALDSSVLCSLKEQGCETGALHPLYSFSPEPIEIPPNILFTYEGTNGARRISETLVSDLQGKLIDIKPEHKPLYHAAALLAANSLPAVMYQSESIMKEIFEDSIETGEHIEVLIRSVLENIKGRELKEAITGPIARQDKLTLFKHEEALKRLNNDETTRLYTAIKLIIQEIMKEA